MTVEPLVLHSSPIVTIGYVMQVFLSLGIVIAIIYVTAKFVLPRFKISTPGTMIKVLDRVILEPQVTAYVLKAGEKSYLIVISNKQIEKIDTIEGKLSA
ncbi:MAG: flagellar biosynthetic protein FliO [Candidatus Margulisiibacteriota bacterium]|jgi:flagellar biogenesis protein FliO